MSCQKMIIRIILLTTFINNVLSIGFLVPIIGAGISLGLAKVGKYFYDDYIECNDEYVIANFTGLEQSFKEKIYGQHIATQVVLDALRSHWDSPHAQKALTMSFHGNTGSGKNYITKFIINKLYEKGSMSKNVHTFTARVHFPNENNVLEYKENLYNWIKGNVSKCPYQLFIFDEVDKMPIGVLDSIKPFIDYHEEVDKVNFRKSVFIFLSNTGAGLITNHMLALWRAGTKREDIKLSDFETLISRGAFNENDGSTFLERISTSIIEVLKTPLYLTGGFYQSDNIKSNLIDHYIPFLPMEYEHVVSCIRDEFVKREVYIENGFNEVLSVVDWGPEPERIFSKTGCKRLSQKVGIVAQKYKKLINLENLNVAQLV